MGVGIVDGWNKAEGSVFCKINIYISVTYIIFSACQYSVFGLFNVHPSWFLVHLNLIAPGILPVNTTWEQEIFKWEKTGRGDAHVTLQKSSNTSAIFLIVSYRWRMVNGWLAGLPLISKRIFSTGLVASAKKVHQVTWAQDTFIT